MSGHLRLDVFDPNLVGLELRFLRRRRAGVRSAKQDRSDHQDCGTRNHGYAAADLPIVALTRGITCSAMSCIERLASAGSTQSMPA